MRAKELLFFGWLAITMGCTTKTVEEDPSRTVNDPTNETIDVRLLTHLKRKSNESGSPMLYNTSIGISNYQVCILLRDMPNPNKIGLLNYHATPDVIALADSLMSELYKMLKDTPDPIETLRKIDSDYNHLITWTELKYYKNLNAPRK